mmetsp:Transcript_19693/g.43045  ORF Transcript_19693/g.43045 Transcript_19693/m.43045 type:complete len:235 (+) Transcript_19693:366-1070(+)
MDGIDELTRVLQAGPLARAIWAANPASVHEVGRRSVLLKLCGEHLRVDIRVPDEEGRAEASGKGCLGLLDAHLSARNFRSVARNEVVHHLLGGEFRDGRQHAKGVASKEDDLLRMVGNLCWDPRVGDEAQRIRHASVLGEAGVLKEDMSRVLVMHNVLEHGAEANGIENFRLLLPGEVDALRIAAALDVENTLGMPYMLVVTDEVPLRVCTQSSLPGAAEAKEDRDIVILTNVG